MVNAITMSYFTAGPVTGGQKAGEFERSTLALYRVDTPSGYVSVPVGKGGASLLTIP
jgi:hypothetical protein